jgi:hypothetical protein
MAENRSEMRRIGKGLEALVRTGDDFESPSLRQ